MSSDKEKQLFLRAVTAISSPLAIVGRKYRVLASNPAFKKRYPQQGGAPCYAFLHARSRPCSHCVLEPSPAGSAGGIACDPGNSRGEAQQFPVSEAERSCCLPGDSSGWQRTGDAAQLLCCSIDALPGHVLVVGLISEKIADLAQDLKRSNNFLHNLLLSSVDAVIAADMKGRIFIFNDSASQILGYSQEEALTGLNIRTIYPEGRAGEVMQALRSDDYGGSGKLKDFRVEVLSRQGELIPISLNASIVYESSAVTSNSPSEHPASARQEVATLGFFRDLRESRRLEKELEDVRIQLFQSAKMAALGKLAAGVAHQINNPLSGISLFAQLLLEDYDLEDGAREDVQRILEDVTRCRDTVKELLEFARQSADECKPQDINRIVERTMFLLEKQALFHDIEIIRNFDEDLPKIPCDLKQLGHVVMNLVLNAAEAMEGHGRLLISTCKQDGHVLLSFQDTGPGIPPEILPRIFDPFYTTKEEGKGTGLGLSIAYRIVQNHGGRIWAENLASGGAVFFITLPLPKGFEGGETG